MEAGAAEGEAEAEAEAMEGPGREEGTADMAAQTSRRGAAVTLSALAEGRHRLSCEMTLLNTGTLQLREPEELQLREPEGACPGVSEEVVES